MEMKKQKIDTMQNSREAVMDNKELILKSALDLFYAKGYDAVGVQEIVDKAGISKPTLYYYFGSKLGLLQNLLETGYQEFESRLIDMAKVQYAEAQLEAALAEALLLTGTTISFLPT